MTAPFYDMVDLRPARSQRVIRGLRIVAMGPNLAADLRERQRETVDELASFARTALLNSQDTAQEGEPEGHLYETRWRGQNVWIERISDTEATIFYPHER